MASWVSSHGVKVQVIAGCSHYPEWIARNNQLHVEKKNGISIIRVPVLASIAKNGLGKVIYYCDFGVKTFLILLGLLYKKNYDTILVVCPTLTVIIAAYMASLLTRKDIHLCAHIQDIEISLALSLGMLKAGPLAGLISRIEKKIYSLAQLSTISSGMKKSLCKFCEEEPRIFPNWFNEEVLEASFETKRIERLREKLGFHPDDFIIQYSGTLGKKQGLGLIHMLSEIASPFPHYKIAISASSSVLEYIRNQQRHGHLLNVYPFDLFSAIELPDWLCTADVHIVQHLSKSINLAMPSKLLNALATLSPVLLLSSSSSELSELSEICFLVDSSSQLTKALNEIEIDRQNTTSTKRSNAIQYLDRYRLETALSGIGRHLRVGDF